MVKINPIDKLEDLKVKVFALDGTNRYRIEWVPPKVPVEGYYIFAGEEPYYIRNRISNLLPPTQTYYEFQPKIFLPYDVVLYFWVAYKSNGQVYFIDEFGSNYILTKGLMQYNDDRYSDTTKDIVTYDAQWHFEEIRRRAKAVLEDVGEEVILYKRQVSGVADNYGFKDNDEFGFNLDPNIQSQYRTDDTYGTGYYPGFFPGIKIMARFGQVPPLTFKIENSGLRTEMSYREFWTLWEPYIRQWDVIYRPLNGKVYIVDEAGISNIRGVNIIQRISISLANSTDPICKINHDDLIIRWDKITQIGYQRLEYIPDNLDNTFDYLLFRMI